MDSLRLVDTPTVYGRLLGQPTLYARARALANHGRLSHAGVRIMDESMIGLAEAAVQLLLPYQDVHRLLLTGKLTGVKRGSRWYVRIADVRRLQQIQKRDAMDARQVEKP